jgi:alpha-beta hydrolase superfamily lysophospholipase
MCCEHAPVQPSPSGSSESRSRTTGVSHPAASMILIGHSRGAVVTASDLAAHSERVEAVIALAPGSLVQDADIAADPAVRPKRRPAPAAHDIIGDAETASPPRRHPRNGLAREVLRS